MEKRITLGVLPVDKIDYILSGIQIFNAPLHELVGGIPKYRKIGGKGQILGTQMQRHSHGEHDGNG